MCIYLSTDILSNITKSFTYMSIQNEIKNFKIYHKFCSNNIKYFFKTNFSILFLRIRC